MKRSLFVGAVAMSTCTMLAVSAPAWAHVVVVPEEATAGGYETFTVSVPTEKEVPTTKVRVEVPDGFVVSGVQPVPGWDYQFEEKGGLITAITWSGGEIRPKEFQQFLFQAKAPDDPGSYPWKAFQTYADGSVVEWVGPPDAEEPASVVEVVSGSAGAENQEDATARSGSSSATLPSSGGTSLATVFAVGACVLALLALVVRRRGR